MTFHAFKIAALLGAVLLVGTSCKSSKKAQRDAEPADVETSAHPAVNIQQGVDLSEVPTSPTGIERAWIDGHTLSMAIAYSGGCKEHEFDLLGNRFYMKSMPPKTNVLLFHNANKDHCRQLIKDTLHFDLKPLQYKGHNTLMVLLKDYNEPLRYTY